MIHACGYHIPIQNPMLMTCLLERVLARVLWTLVIPIGGFSAACPEVIVSGEVSWHLLIMLPGTR
jgi:hypothetical protein